MSFFHCSLIKKTKETNEYYDQENESKISKSEAEKLI